MANPRKVVDFEGIGLLTATYLIDGVTITYDATKAGGSAVVGRAVTLSDDAVVALTEDGDAVEGKLLTVERDGACTVQVGGFCTLPGGEYAVFIYADGTLLGSIVFNLN